MKNKISTVFIDMDGVLVDWLEGMRIYCHKPESFYDCFKADPSKLSHAAVDELYGGRDILQKIQLEAPVSFWYNLKLFPWADKLIATVKGNFPVAFLTHPGKNQNAAAAKLQWQLDKYPEIPLIMTKHKYLAASETKVLIDDDNWQTSRFDNAGGLAIQWPNQFKLQNHPLDIVAEVTIGEIMDRIKDYESVL